MHQHDVGRERDQCLEPGQHAVLTRGPAGHHGAVGEALERGFDQGGVAHGLQGGDVRRNGLGGPAHDRLAGDEGELLGRGAAEPGAGARGDEDGGDTHGGRFAGGGAPRQPAIAGAAARKAMEAARRPWTSPETARPDLLL
jgi:hypothetical protein